MNSPTDARKSGNLDQATDRFDAAHLLLGDGSPVIDELDLRVIEAQPLLDVVGVERIDGTLDDLHVLLRHRLVAQPGGFEGPVCERLLALAISQAGHYVMVGYVACSAVPWISQKDSVEEG